MKSDQRSPHDAPGPVADTASLALDNPVLLAMIPLGARPVVRTIAAFDRTIADQVRRARGGEAMLAQLRLAWWRDEVAALGDARARPDPLLADLAGHAERLPGHYLLAIIDAWEAILMAQPIDHDIAVGQSARRGAAVFALTRAAIDGISETDEVPVDSGPSWAVTDLAANIGDARLADTLFATAGTFASGDEPVRALRALDGWARRMARRGGRRAALRDQAWLLRMGLFGR